MGGIFQRAAIPAMAALLIGCEAPPPASGSPIDGPYFLSAGAMIPGGRMICYRRPTGACDLRVPPPVLAYGWDEDFVSAAVRSAGDPNVVLYFYVVREFDGPRADVARAVRGPFDEKAFIGERRRHGVPGVAEMPAPH